MFGGAVVLDSLSALERYRELVGIDSGTVGNDLAKKGVWGGRGLNLVLCVFFVKRVRVFGGRRKGGGVVEKCVHFWCCLSEFCAVCGVRVCERLEVPRLKSLKGVIHVQPIGNLKSEALACCSASCTSSSMSDDSYPS